MWVSYSYFFNLWDLTHLGEGKFPVQPDNSHDADPQIKGKEGAGISVNLDQLLTARKHASRIFAGTSVRVGQVKRTRHFQVSCGRQKRIAVCAIFNKLVWGTLTITDLAVNPLAQRHHFRTLVLSRFGILSAINWTVPIVNKWMSNVFVCLEHFQCFQRTFYFISFVFFKYFIWFLVVWYSKRINRVVMMVSVTRIDV